MVKNKAEGTGPSKKTVQKKKQQIIEEKTFGLKNKNKSKKVQQQIKSIEKNVMNSGDARVRKMEEERKKAKEEAKLRKKAMEEERNALFGEALLAVQKKNKAADQQAGKIEAKGRDAQDEGDKKSTSRAMKMMFQMDAAEMDAKLREDPFYVPTLEDEVESQRSKLVEELRKSGKGTPVTPASFAAWQESKRLKRQEEIRKKVETELRKKKGGKGLSVLSGRDLFEYKRELFDKFDVDDQQDGYVEEEEGGGDNDDDEGQANLGNRQHGENGGTGRDVATSSDQEEFGGEPIGASVEEVADKVQKDLFLQEEDDDLDDLIEDDDQD